MNTTFFSLIFKTYFTQHSPSGELCAESQVSVLRVSQGPQVGRTRARDGHLVYLLMKDWEMPGDLQFGCLTVHVSFCGLMWIKVSQFIFSSCFPFLSLIASSVVKISGVSLPGSAIRKKKRNLPSNACSVCSLSARVSTNFISSISLNLETVHGQGLKEMTTRANFKLTHAAAKLFSLICMIITSVSRTTKLSHEKEMGWLWIPLTCQLFVLRTA